jgi:hypothetical protein
VCGNAPLFRTPSGTAEEKIDFSVMEMDIEKIYIGGPS